MPMHSHWTPSASHPPRWPRPSPSDGVGRGRSAQVPLSLKWAASPSSTNSTRSADESSRSSGLALLISTPSSPTSSALVVLVNLRVDTLTAPAAPQPDLCTTELRPIRRLAARLPNIAIGPSTLTCPRCSQSSRCASKVEPRFRLPLSQARPSYRPGRPWSEPPRQTRPA
jgi:hypothetical protein